MRKNLQDYMKKLLLPACPMLMIASGVGLGISRLIDAWVSFGLFAAIGSFAGVYTIYHIEKLENELKTYREGKKEGKV